MDTISTLVCSKFGYSHKVIQQTIGYTHGQGKLAIWYETCLTSVGFKLGTKGKMLRDILCNIYTFFV